MRLGDWRMTVETLQTGQPRPYAPHIYHYRVTFEWIAYRRRIEGEPLTFEPAKWSKELVEKHLRAIQYWEDDDKGDWASPKLKFIQKIQEGVWEFMVTEAFTD